MIARIIQAIDALDQFPHRYKILEAVEALGVEVRSMPVPPYLNDRARSCAVFVGSALADGTVHTGKRIEVRAIPSAIMWMKHECA